jgi:riboflavin kinase / FMN adenylyltransferase
MTNIFKKGERLTIKQLIGTVVAGDGRGMSIGFPTANLKLNEEAEKPTDGVYACLVQVLPDDVVYQAILHVGPRPTFRGAEASVEVHILDFKQRTLYGSELRAFSFYYIRSNEKFSSSKELIDAITQDSETAKELLSNKL